MPRRLVLHEVLLRVEPPPAGWTLETGASLLPRDRYLVVVRLDRLDALELFSADRTGDDHTASVSPAARRMTDAADTSLS